MKKEDDNVYAKERLVVLPENSLLDDQIIEKLDIFFEHTPPREIRDNLLEIYLNYIIFCNESLPADFEKIADNIYNLLKFLEYADKRKNKDTSQLKEEKTCYSIRRVA